MRLFNSARKYHQLTKYSFNDVKKVYHEFPPENKVLPVKNYPGKPIVELAKNFDLQRGNLVQDFERSAGFNQFFQLQPQEISLQSLSQLLYLCNGITLLKVFGPKKFHLRAAPSASASYPVEIYLIANHITSLKKGLYYFNPIEHSLVSLRAGDWQSEISEATYDLSFVKGAPAVLVFTTVFERNFWRYQDRALRFSLMDTGYIMENLVLAGSSLDLAVNVVGDFVDDQLNRFLDIEPDSETALMVAAVGEIGGPIKNQKYSFTMPGEEKDVLPDARGSLSQAFSASSAHFKAGEREVSVNVTLPFKKSPLLPVPKFTLISLPNPLKEFSRSTTQVITGRRSSHNFVRLSISGEELSTILHYLNRVPVLYGYPAFSTYLAVHDVTKLSNGLYRYHPESHQLELLKKGTFRGDISYLTQAQDAVFNCSAALFFAVDFSQIDLFSNRGYCYAHFNIGMLSETVYLVANALELGARGIGIFFDDDIGTFFDLQPPDQVILGGVIVGKT